MKLDQKSRDYLREKALQWVGQGFTIDEIKRLLREIVKIWQAVDDEFEKELNLDSENESEDAPEDKNVLENWKDDTVDGRGSEF